MNNHKCAKNFNLYRFKIIKKCANISDLIKLEAICIFIRKLIIIATKKLDYTVFCLLNVFFGFLNVVFVCFVFTLLTTIINSVFIKLRFVILTFFLFCC